MAAERGAGFDVQWNHGHGNTWGRGPGGGEGQRSLNPGRALDDQFNRAGVILANDAGDRNQRHPARGRLEAVEHQVDGKIGFGLFDDQVIQLDRAVGIVQVLGHDDEIAVGRGGEINPRRRGGRVAAGQFGALGILDDQEDLGRGIDLVGLGRHRVLHALFAGKNEAIQIRLVEEPAGDADRQLDALGLRDVVVRLDLDDLANVRSEDGNGPARTAGPLRHDVDDMAVGGHAHLDRRHPGHILAGKGDGCLLPALHGHRHGGHDVRGIGDAQTVERLAAADMPGIPDLDDVFAAGRIHPGEPAVRLQSRLVVAVEAGHFAHRLGVEHPDHRVKRRTQPAGDHLDGEPLAGLGGEFEIIADLGIGPADDHAGHRDDLGLFPGPVVGGFIDLREFVHAEQAGVAHAGFRRQPN